MRIEEENVDRSEAITHARVREIHASSLANSMLPRGPPNFWVMGKT